MQQGTNLKPNLIEFKKRRLKKVIKLILDNVKNAFIFYKFEIIPNAKWFF